MRCSLDGRARPDLNEGVALAAPGGQALFGVAPHSRRAQTRADSGGHRLKCAALKKRARQEWRWPGVPRRVGWGGVVAVVAFQACAFRPKRVASVSRPASFRRIAHCGRASRVRFATSSPVRCSPCGLRSACGFRACPCPSSSARSLCVEAAPKSRDQQNVRRRDSHERKNHPYPPGHEHRGLSSRTPRGSPKSRRSWSEAQRDHERKPSGHGTQRQGLGDREGVARFFLDDPLSSR